MADSIGGFRFFSAVRNCIINHQTKVFNRADWLEWRYCYEGGRIFRDEYLEEFVGSVGQEGKEAFERRRSLTPIPSYAKKAVNNVKNAIARRLSAVDRDGGSDLYQNLVNGIGRGVDLKGASMKTFITKKILPELLVLGSTGVLVDAPVIRPQAGRSVVTRADVPRIFQPYLCRFPIEAIPIAIPAPVESPSDWSHVLVEVRKHEFNLLKGEQDCTSTYRYFWLEDEDPARMGRVNTIFLDINGEAISEVIQLNLTQIPFVMYEIDNSLMTDVCSYQIALLNMMSADSSSAIDSNFTFLTKQESGADMGDHLDEEGDADAVRVGSDRGLKYGKGQERPGFISPPSEPLTASVELRREMKKEVHELVLGILEDMGGSVDDRLDGEGSIEAGLKIIGEELERGETRIVDHFSTYEERRPSQRQVATISYPESWSLKTDKQRLDEAKDFFGMAKVVVGEKNKKHLIKKGTKSLNHGLMSAEDLNELLTEIDQSPVGLADPTVIIPAHDSGILCKETSAAALGAKDPKKEAECSQAEAVERANMVSQAQADANQAGRGNPDQMADPGSETLAKEGDNDGAANLREPGNPGRPNTGDNE